MSSAERSAEVVELTVAPESAGSRLDWYLARQFPTYSRTHLRRVINAACVKVNGKRTKASHHLAAGDRISLELPEMPRSGPEPEEIPLEILYEDESLAAINKPPGMVVHPAKGHWKGTLASALQFHFDRLSSVGGPTRPGIIHRLDRDTSGVIVVAKHDRAHQNLALQFEHRTASKEYFAIVAGSPNLDRDLIDLPIGLHPQHREKMAVRRDDPAGRPAQSFYEVVERFDGFASVRVAPKTGRTHQIRVHLASIGCPVLCDRAYGGRARLTLGELQRRGTGIASGTRGGTGTASGTWSGTGSASGQQGGTGSASGMPVEDVVLLERQALHAHRLTLAHPETGELLEFVAPLPADLQGVLAALAEFRS